MTVFVLQSSKTSNGRENGKNVTLTPFISFTLTKYCYYSILLVAAPKELMSRETADLKRGKGWGTSETEV